MLEQKGLSCDQYQHTTSLGSKPSCFQEGESVVQYLSTSSLYLITTVYNIGCNAKTQAG